MIGQEVGYSLRIGANLQLLRHHRQTVRPHRGQIGPANGALSAAAEGYPRAARRTKNGRRRSSPDKELRRALDGCEVLFEMGEVLHV